MILPADELVWRFSRSGGPGGQNVNKVESRVELMFRPSSSRALTPWQRQQAQQALGSRVDDEGYVHVVASEHRSQLQNREAALRRLEQMLEDALRPRRSRIRTKVPRAVRQARLAGKRIRSEVKARRSYQGGDE